eukprot:GHVS01089979.1.p1 GENE.GHVS01089979.1~~GHVS01089979.1.p1  ORF type:complete len:221 (-),score=33.56 GHVS01089979.1:98-760(-)
MDVSGEVSSSCSSPAQKRTEEEGGRQSVPPFWSARCRRAAARGYSESDRRRVAVVSDSEPQWNRGGDGAGEEQGKGGGTWCQRVTSSEKLAHQSEAAAINNQPQLDRCFDDRTTSLRWNRNTSFRLNRTSFLDALSDASLECTGGETTAWRYCLMVGVVLYLFACLYMMAISKLLPRTGISFLDAIKDDWYYSIWLPFLFPTTVVFVYWNWVSMKYFSRS